MKKHASIFLLCCLAAAAFPVAAQDAPSPGQFGRGANMPMREQMREMSPEQREQMREARQQRRETWQQMSPEDRHQLRRDIRDAGQTLYPRGGGGRRHHPD